MNNPEALAIKNHIVFQFVDEIDHDGKFIEKHDTIHIMSGDFQDSSALPRWGKVVLAGPEVDESISAAGTQILIESLKWTMGFKIESDTFWRTDESCVLAVAE